MSWCNKWRRYQSFGAASIFFMSLSYDLTENHTKKALSIIDKAFLFLQKSKNLQLF